MRHQLKYPTLYFAALRINVKVVHGSGKPYFDGDTLVIHTTEKAQKGMANRDVVLQVAEHYCVPSSDVHIKAGFKSRKKVLEVPSEENKQKS